MDMEQDWKAQRTEATRVGLVAQFDQARRVTALESAIKYEIEAADRMRAQMMAAIECAAVERSEHAARLAHRDSVIAQQAATVGTLRAELASAMRAIAGWSADHTPALTLGLRRADIEYEGIDLVADYDIVPGYDDESEECEAASLIRVWHEGADITGLMSEEAFDACEAQCQAALDDWIGDERDELATAGVLSLREAQEVAA